MKQLANIYIRLFLLISLITLYTGCSVNPPKPCKVNGKVYGVYDGMFRGKWWNYYQIGTSYIEGLCLKEAEKVLKIALNKNNKDERDVVTYGMHRIDYFPHRELGIVLYHQQKYTKAINELEASISTEKSGRSLHYLNKARRAFVLYSFQDKEHPKILIYSDTQKNIVTNNYLYPVEGEIIDNNFVNCFSIDDTEIKIEEVLPKINFRKNVLLKPGKNVIRLKACDVVKNTYEKKLLITLDINGPAIGIQSLMHKDQNKYDFKCSVYDISGIQSILIYLDDQIQYQIKKKQKLIHISKQLIINNNRSKVLVEAKDSIGNISQYSFSLAEIHKKNFEKVEVSSLLASNTFIPKIVKVEKNIQEPRPLIQLSNISEKEDIYVDELNTQVKISNSKPIKKIEIYVNDDQVAPELPPYIVGKLFCQSIKFYLKDGKNIIRIIAYDKKKNEKKYIITQKRINNPETMLPVAMIPAVIDQKNSKYKSRILYWLNKEKRFTIIPMQDIDELSQWHNKSSQVDLISCINKGEIQPPPWYLQWSFEKRTSFKEAIIHSNNPKTLKIDFGFFEIETEFLEKKKVYKLKSLEILIDLYDFESYRRPIASLKIYKEDIDEAALTENVCQSLAQEFFKKFPILQGRITNDLNNNRIFIHNGKNRNIQIGMRFAIYEKVFVKNIIEQKFAFSDISLISEAKIISFSEDQTPIAQIINHPNYKKVKPFHLYITR